MIRRAEKGIVAKQVRILPAQINLSRKGGDMGREQYTTVSVDSLQREIIRALAVVQRKSMKQLLYDALGVAVASLEPEQFKLYQQLIGDSGDERTIA